VRLCAEKQIFELVRGRVGKQQRGIIRRDQRRGVDAAMALGLKEAQKQLADFVSRSKLHDSFSVMGEDSGGESRTDITRFSQAKAAHPKMDGV
jgi:hypothetical protein